MHIGIDTRLTYYRTGGISTYMRRLVSALESIDTRNEYTIFQSRKASEMLTKRFKTANLWTPCHHRIERFALSVELARFNLDVLHSPDFIPPLQGARKHIITVHDLTFLHYPQHLTQEARHYYNDQIKMAVKQANHILADSNATKTDLVNMLDVPAEKITVHMLGVEEQFKPLDASLLEAQRQKHQLPQQFILFVGTFEPRKNILGLLQAYKKLVDDWSDAPPIVLVGRRGWLFDETMQSVRDLNLGNRVLWRENIDDDDLPAVYNLASVLVLPSFYEGFGFPALEAMACGTVPIVSNRSSLPEVVGEVGLQINPDDTHAIKEAIQKALTDTEWQQLNRKLGLERAKQFRWETTAQIALSVYEAVGKR
ncbi:MAG: glycosyltransferase family 4 protein [Anaerolineae bacterium]|nr:glycosyltransferase family 4 protein [Anaerolineae bacterium]